jgi:hypothetical protein
MAAGDWPTWIQIHLPRNNCYLYRLEPLSRSLSFVNDSGSAIETLHGIRSRTVLPTTCGHGWRPPGLAVFFGTQPVVRMMLRRADGHVIFIASDAAMRRFSDGPVTQGGQVD